MKPEKQLYQWDVNQYLTGINPAAQYVDYTIGNEVIRLETDGTRCRIPDEVLQTYGGKTCYERYPDGTFRAYSFTVLYAPKPPNYVYTPEERTTFEALTARVDAAIEEIKRRADSGEFTPVKGVDYFTNAEKVEMMESVSSGAVGEFRTVVDSATTEYNDNHNSKLAKYNANASEKLTTYDTNAEQHTSDYNSNAEQKLESYNQNHAAKVAEYNQNAETKTAEFDSNAAALQTEVDRLRGECDNLADEIVDARLGADGVTYPSLGAAIRYQFTDLKSDLDDSLDEIRIVKIGNNLVDEDISTLGFLFADGSISESSTYKVSGYIEIKPNTIYSLGCYESDYKKLVKESTKVVLQYDINKEVIQGTYLKNDTELSISFTTDSSAKYVRVCYKYNGVNKLVMLNEGSSVKGYSKYKRTIINTMEIDNYDSVLTKKVGKNIFDSTKSTEGVLLSNDEIIESSNYKTSQYFKVKSGNPITFSPKIIRLIQLGNEKELITGGWHAEFDTGNSVTYTPTQDGYVRVSYYKNTENSFQVEYGNSVTQYEKYKLSVEDDVYLNDKMVEQISGMFNPALGNVLYGKTWYACGDSFTDYTDSNYTPSEYPHMVEDCGNKCKTYPFIIGLRNAMKVHNISASGQTLATPSDGSFNNCFSNDSLTMNYKYIPSDADYITIMLGINDSGHISGSGTTQDGEDASGVIPIGTINDTDNTTFYGAWNVVLKYLIENHPFAHIGIIVSNGSSKEHVKATIECAKKWGIAYLNMDGDYQVPLMHRVNTKDETCDEAKQIRLNKFSIDKANGDTHPNYKAHEYESYFIENFLRSI